MTAPTEALARIAALCDDTEENGDPVVWLNVDVLRAVLAEVTPETGSTLDRDQSRRVLDRLGFGDPDVYDVEGIIDDFAACVRPVAGVTLAPEESRIVRWLLMYWGADDEQARKAPPPSRESIQALAARLEATR